MNVVRWRWRQPCIRFHLNACNNHISVCLHSAYYSDWIKPGGKFESICWAGDSILPLLPLLLLLLFLSLGSAAPNLEQGGPEQEAYKYPSTITSMLERGGGGGRIKGRGHRKGLSVVDFRLMLKHRVRAICHGNTGSDHWISPFHLLFSNCLCSSRFLD